MKHRLNLISAVFIFVFSYGCLKDSEMCGGDDNMKWDPATKYCFFNPPADTETDVDSTPVDTVETEAEDGGGGDGGMVDTATEAEDTGDWIPSGLGNVCTTEDSCEQYEADYCVEVPGENGYCSVIDCSTEKNDCPGGFHCCEYTFAGYPTICLSPDKWDLYHEGLCVNN